MFFLDKNDWSEFSPRRGAQKENGRFFYTIFPFGRFGPDNWAPALKSMLADHRFLIDFMYGAVDGAAVRLVIALKHRTNPQVKPHGVGVMIQKLFTFDGKRGFSPVLALNDSVLVLAIAHVARYRVSVQPELDMFSPFNPRIGDVGTELAETVVEWVRFSSCRLMLDGLQRELQHDELRQRVRKYNEDYCRHLGLDFAYDVEEPKDWNSRDKKAHTVSALFQVSAHSARASVKNWPCRDTRPRRSRPTRSRTGRSPHRSRTYWRR